MADPVRVMLEQGKKKRVVASAFDWPGWDRSAKIGADVLAVLAAYRPRYAKVAELAGFGAEFRATGEFEVVERLDGIGMTDFYGVSGRTAAPENDPMSEVECERKIALLRACWSTFDDVAAHVSTELRKGPRGGGRERDQIIRHVNGTEIDEIAPKVGVKVPLEMTPRPFAPSGMPSSRQSGNTTPAASRRVMGAAVSDPALCLAYARPRLGAGGPGPDERARLGSRNPVSGIEDALLIGCSAWSCSTLW